MPSTGRTTSTKHIGAVQVRAPRLKSGQRLTSSSKERERALAASSRAVAVDFRDGSSKETVHSVSVSSGVAPRIPAAAVQSTSVADDDDLSHDADRATASLQRSVKFLSIKLTAGGIAALVAVLAVGVMLSVRERHRFSEELAVDAVSATMQGLESRFAGVAAAVAGVGEAVLTARSAAPGGVARAGSWARALEPSLSFVAWSPRVTGDSGQLAAGNAILAATFGDSPPPLVSSENIETGSGWGTFVTEGVPFSVATALAGMDILTEATAATLSPGMPVVLLTDDVPAEARAVLTGAGAQVVVAVPVFNNSVASMDDAWVPATAGGREPSHANIADKNPSPGELLGVVFGGVSLAELADDVRVRRVFETTMHVAVADDGLSTTAADEDVLVSRQTVWADYESVLGMITYDTSDVLCAGSAILFGGSFPAQRVSAPLSWQRESAGDAAGADAAASNSVDGDKVCEQLRSGVEWVSQAHIRVGGRSWSVMLAASDHDWPFSEWQSAPRTYAVIGVAVFGALGLVCVWRLLRRFGSRIVSEMEAAQEASLELAAEAAEAQHQRTLSYTCHELRNPLHAINASVQFLLADLQKGSPLRRDAETISVAANSMHMLLNDTLDMSKIRAGHMDIVPRVTEIRSLIRDICHQHRSMCAVVIRGHVNRVTPTEVMVDPLRIRQLLANGLTNAAKHTSEGAIDVNVSVVARVVSDGQPAQRLLRFEVVDSGVGFGDIDPQTLFSPYASGVEDATPLSVVPRKVPAGATQVTSPGTPGRLQQMTSPNEGGATGRSAVSVVATPGTLGSPREPGGGFSPAGAPRAGPLVYRTQVSRHSQDDDTDHECGSNIVTGSGGAGGAATSVGAGSLSTVAIEEAVATDGSGSHHSGAVASMYTSGHSSGPTAHSLGSKDSLPSAAPASPTRKYSRRTTAAQLLKKVRASGIGLGLPICKQLVTHMGGEIGLSRGRNGTGACFWFEIPLVLPQPGGGRGGGVLQASAGVDSDEDLSLPDHRHLTMSRITAGEVGASTVSIQDRPGRTLRSGEQRASTRSVKSYASGKTESTAGHSSSGVPSVRSAPSAALSMRTGESLHGSDDTVSVSGRVAALRASPEAMTPTSPQAKGRGPPLGLHVLAVDDDSTNLRLCVRMLESLGCSAETLTDGDELIDMVTGMAASRLRQGSGDRHEREGISIVQANQEAGARLDERFDAILLDIVMVRSDGAEVCRELRRTYGVSVPIVAATGNAGTDDVAKYLQGGFSAVLTKPYTVSSLRAVLTSEAVAKSRAQKPAGAHI